MHQATSAIPQHILSPSSQLALRRLADSATMVVWMTNIRGACTYFNPRARALFSDMETIYPSDWLQFIHPEDLSGARTNT